MFRSAASLIAKKTAIVAITGTVVLGGATLALAEIGAPPDPLTGECGSGEVLGIDGLCEADPNANPEPDAPADCDDPDTEAVETCPEPDAPADCDDPDTEAVETCPEPDAPADCDDPDTEAVETCPEGEGEGDDTDADADADLENEVVAEHPDNHGKAVSEAARGVEGSPCAGMTGREKGQCVANVATGGKKAPAEAPLAEEEPVAEAPVAEEPVVTEDPAPVVEEPVETQTAPEKPAKGNNAGGNGKGKGKA